jgi:hypothetical protein
MKPLKRISASELSLILNISEDTIKILAKTKQIPSKFENRRIWFDFPELLEHFQRLEGGTA